MGEAALYPAIGFVEGGVRVASWLTISPEFFVGIHPFVGAGFKDHANGKNPQQTFPLRGRIFRPARKAFCQLLSNRLRLTRKPLGKGPRRQQ